MEVSGYVCVNMVKKVIFIGGVFSNASHIPHSTAAVSITGGSVGIELHRLAASTGIVTQLNVIKQKVSFDPDIFPA